MVPSAVNSVTYVNNSTCNKPSLHRNHSVLLLKSGTVQKVAQYSEVLFFGVVCNGFGEKKLPRLLFHVASEGTE